MSRRHVCLTLDHPEEERDSLIPACALLTCTDGRRKTSNHEAKPQLQDYRSFLLCAVSCYAASRLMESGDTGIWARTCTASCQLELPRHVVIKEL